MKRMLFTALLGLCCFLAKAQSINITNMSSCTVYYYIAAVDASCSNTTGSITYAVAPGGSVTFANFGAVTWTGTTPGSGWQWAYIKEWNICGPMSWTPPACGQDVCAVGIPCTGLPNQSCMNITTSCNTCSAIKTSWSSFGSSAGVKIW